MRIAYMAHYLNRHYPEYGLFDSAEELRTFFEDENHPDWYLPVPVPVLDAGEVLDDNQIQQHFNTWPRQGQR